MTAKNATKKLARRLTNAEFGSYQQSHHKATELLATDWPYADYVEAFVQGYEVATAMREATGLPVDVAVGEATLTIDGSILLVFEMDGAWGYTWAPTGGRAAVASIVAGDHDTTDLSDSITVQRAARSEQLRARLVKAAGELAAWFATSPHAYPGDDGRPDAVGRNVDG